MPGVGDLRRHMQQLLQQYDPLRVAERWAKPYPGRKRQRDRSNDPEGSLDPYVGRQPRAA